MPKAETLSIDELVEAGPAPIPPGYWEDLKRVAELEAAGKTRPSFPVLQKFLNEKHGTSFTVSGVRVQYLRVKNG